MAPPPAEKISALACLRPGAWWYFALLPLGGLDAATLSLATAREAALGVAHAAALLAFAYGLNGVTDASLDRSAAKNPLAGRKRAPPSVRALVAGCAAAAAVIAIARSGTPALPAALVVLAVSFAYSAPPRLKSVPFVGTALNAGIFTPLFWLGPAAAPIAPALPVLFTGLLIQNQLLHEREDLEEDLAARVVTTAAVLGDRGTRIAVGATGAVTALVLTRVADGAVLAACAAGIVLATSTVLAGAPRRRRHRHLAALAGAIAYVLSAWVVT